MTDKRHGLLLLCAGIIEDDVTGKWRSTKLIEEESLRQAPGGELRIHAAAYVASQYDVIVVPGGKGSDQNLVGVSHPHLSEVIQQELISLGVPKEKILREDRSHNTYEQLRKSIALFHNAHITQVTIISSEYHLPRVQAMIQYREELRSEYSQLSPIYRTAEEICMEYEKDMWEPVISSAYVSSWMAQVQQKEKQGIAQIEEGTYTF